MAGLRALRPAAGVAADGPADDRDQRQLLRRAPAEGRLLAPDRLQLAAGRLRGQHQRPRPCQPGGHRHRRLSRQAGPVRRRGELERADHDDPSVRRGAICGVAQDQKRLRRRHSRRRRPAEQEREVRRGLRHRPAGTRQHRAAARRRAERGAHRDRLRPAEGRDVHLRGRQLHPGQHAGPVPRPGSDNAVLLDGGGSSAIVLRRDTGGMWAGAGSPRGSCDTRQVLCDSHERSLPSWLAFN